MWYVIAAYIVWCLLLYFQQDRMIFPRHMTAAPLAGPPAPATVVVRLPLAKGGYVESWFLPATAAGAETGLRVVARFGAQARAPVILFFHGNGELIDYQDFIVENYRRLGCSVLLPEYRGYGRSSGRPSQDAVVADAVRFYDEIVKRDDVDASRIVFHGRSLGGAVAAALAEHRRPRALILESSFASVAGMSRRYLVPSFLLKHPFRTDRLVAESELPMLIFHGSNDRIVPPSHGRRLRDLARNGRYIEYQCGHNDFPGVGNGERYWQAIEDFLHDMDILALEAG